MTPEAHAALWQTLLSVDLVGEIKCVHRPVDDPLPFLLDNQRALRTIGLDDGVWVNVRDVSIAFAARTYRTDERFVVEADGTRWAIEGGPDGGVVRRCAPSPTSSPLMAGSARCSTAVCCRPVSSPDGG